MTTDRKVKKRGGYDPYLLLGVLFLMGMGVVLVYSASSMVAIKRFGSDTYFFNRQVVNVLIAILVLICCRHVPYSFYRTLAYPIIVIAFLSLLALYLPHVGHSVGGAKRWLKVFGMSFQPSEFARLGLIIYLAYSMSKKQERIKAFSIGFAPHAIVLGCFTTLIVMEPDFGMAAMITLLVWIMLFVGGVRLSYLFAAVMGMVPLAYHVLKHVEYARLRVFSVAGEELGLVGVCFITGLYFIILWRGFSIAMKAGDLFATFLATGLTAALGLQACVNAWVALGLLPTTGLTLPFVSYGGTSLVMCAAMIGILMNISARQAAEGGKPSMG